MLKPTMNLSVICYVLLLVLPKRRHVFLEVCLRKKDAGAVGAFEVGVGAVLLLCHGWRLVDV
jgi:hypothetical protein